MLKQPGRITKSTWVRENKGHFQVRPYLIYSLSVFSCNPSGGRAEGTEIEACSIHACRVRSGAEVEDGQRWLKPLTKKEGAARCELLYTGFGSPASSRFSACGNLALSECSLYEVVRRWLEAAVRD